MNLLLDTHTIIWFSENSVNISERSKQLISDTSNNCFISIASVWEMAIKLKINKLYLESSLDDFVNELNQRGFSFLPIKIEHTINTTKLDLHHKDPFDRLLISQAIYEDMTLISRDTVFDKYNITRIW